ncbi:MAG: DUF814 domain-containing protein [Myxococcales bacterium]|nr:DUF814 domain-containing protein [Myxococcales bacterium]
MLSLVELHRAADALAERTGARFDRVIQDGRDRVALVFSGGGERAARERWVLRLCVSQPGGRLSLLGEPPRAPERPPAFAQYLKAHYEGARLAEIETSPDDRVMRLRFRRGDEERSLLLQLLGPRSNLYALGKGDCLDAALRPLRETRRELSLGEPWKRSEGRVPRTGEDRFAEIDDDALLEAIEAAYAEREREAGEDELTRRLLQTLRKQRAGIERKLLKLEKEVSEAAKGEQWRRMGEALKGVLGQVSHGASEVRAADYETGEALTIPLDPGKSPAENLESYFKRHKKAERTLRRAQQEQGATRARLEAHEALEAELETLRATGDRAALLAFAERPEVARSLARFFPDPVQEQDKKPQKVFRVGKRELPTRLVPKRYVSATGHEIWVGKNDAGNDTLTMKLARGNDLFFHLEASPGSHVILRTDGSEEPPQDALLDASELAVHFSKARAAGRASVHIARCKDISKPRGAKPGLVYVHRGRTLSLRRDAARLQRILDSRIED